MSTFKQKLKTLLYDSSYFKNPQNDEQKLNQIILKASRKIKRDNTRQSISLSNYKKYNSSKSILKTKLKIDKYFPKKSIYFKVKPNGISSKTAANMLQALSLIKTEKSRNIKEDSISDSICKYLYDTSKMKRIIKRNMEYFLEQNSHSKIKNSFYNRSKISFENRNNNMTKAVYNLKQIYSKKLNDLMKSKDDIILIDKNEENSKKRILNVYESFNKFRSKPNNQNDSYSRNNFNHLFYRTNFNFKY